MSVGTRALSLALLTSLAGCSSAPPDGDVVQSTSSSSTTAITAQAVGLVRYLNWFDVVTLGDLEAACSDTEGRMAAGGNMRLVRYGANTKALADVPWVAGAGASVFAARDFAMVHGSIANGARGVEGARVFLEHYAVGNVRVTCSAWAGAPTLQASWQGAIHGSSSCGALGYPAGSYASAMVRASALFTQAHGASAPSSPRRRIGAQGAEELVFEPTAGTDAYYAVTAVDLTLHWVLVPGARYFVELVGPGAAGDVALTPKGGVEGDAYALLNMPQVTRLRIGRTHDEQVHIGLTILAPLADTRFDYDILDGGLYVKSLVANPAGLAVSAAAACAPGTWQPGRTQPTSGGQINHWPFTWSYGDGYFAGQPLQ